MPTTRRTPTGDRPKLPPITKWFGSWLSAKDTAETFAEQQGELRVEILDAVKKYGTEDEKGNVWYALRTPQKFTNHKGKTYEFTDLKAERHLSPSQPTPDPEKAKELLVEKGLWLTEKQAKAIRDIQVACPYATIRIDIDADAVAKAWYADVITEAEYERTLVEQTVTYQFRPAES